MGRKKNEKPETLVRARTVALTSDKTKSDYAEYCERIGTAACTRLREFMEAELSEDRASKAQA